MTATIPQAFELAVQHHRTGRLAEAEVIYHQILAVDSRHADALHGLGMIAHQAGRQDVAVDLISKAIAVKPGVATFHSNLGEVYRVLGRLDEAISAYRQAIVLGPHLAGAYCNLGMALYGKGQLDEAIAAYRQAIAFKADLLKAHSNLGIALHDKGELEEAIACHRRVVASQPNLAEAHYNLGVALKAHGELDEAIASFRQAIGLKPGFLEAYCNLGIALHDNQQWDEAIACNRQILALKPDHAEAYSNLGNVLRNKGQSDKAIAAYRQAIALQPGLAEAHCNLGVALKDLGQLDEAIAVCRQAIALQPGLVEAHSNLGGALKDLGQLDEAIAAYRQTLTLKPDHAGAHSNLLFTLHHHPGYDARRIAEEHRVWNRQHAAVWKKFMKPHSNDPNPGRRLRIGYVSADFRDHVVGRYVMPLFERHDRAQFDVFCYSGVGREDEMTARFRSMADEWRNILGVRDQQVAEQIRVDGVDILVDLSLHAAANRLLVFAQQPAPVQVSYIGYPASTGLEAIGYRISDRWLEAGVVKSGVFAGGDVRDTSAEQLCLIESFLCYEPCGIEVAVNELPAQEKGWITFGCLNGCRKINERVLALWSRILGCVEGSRLMLVSTAGSHREWALATLQQFGVEASRVEFVKPRPRREYLELYHRIDIGLETFPYNGHTTSLDAYWMGVPVVGLAGELPVSRAGLSNLMNLGLPELVAYTEDEYVKLVVELAGDRGRLARLRATLREQMEGSVLMDAPRYVRQIEQAYREMWRQWCHGRAGEGRSLTFPPSAPK